MKLEKGEEFLRENEGLKILILMMSQIHPFESLNLHNELSVPLFLYQARRSEPLENMCDSHVFHTQTYNN